MIVVLKNGSNGILTHPNTISPQIRLPSYFPFTEAFSYPGNYHTNDHAFNITKTQAIDLSKVHHSRDTLPINPAINIHRDINHRHRVLREMKEIPSKRECRHFKGPQRLLTHERSYTRPLRKNRRPEKRVLCKENT